jgi:hypothetical protein
MLYADFAAYEAAGGSLTKRQYEVWGFRASRQIDRLTYGRAAPALAAHPDELQEPLVSACIQITDLLYQSGLGLQRAAAGLSGAATTDGYSEYYAVDAQSSGYRTRTACRNALEIALGSDPYGLLYAGVI